MKPNEKTTVQKLGKGVYRIASSNRSAVSGRFAVSKTAKPDQTAVSGKPSSSFTASAKKYA